MLKRLHWLCFGFWAKFKVLVDSLRPINGVLYVLSPPILSSPSVKILFSSCTVCSLTFRGQIGCGWGGGRLFAVVLYAAVVPMDLFYAVGVIVCEIN